ALILAVVAAVLAINMGKIGGETAETPEIASNDGPSKPIVDTGVVKPPPVAAPKPKPKVYKPRPSTPKAAPVAAAPPAGPQAITIKITDGTKFTSLEVKCQNGFRARGSFSGGSATVQSVPIEDCTVFFKGGAPAKTAIRGGQTKSCSFEGATSNCR
ncbi:MAG: hypothetical protein HN348_21405, partial [Proteobacteria bacterium]|nr:hypothetical protein [Pseudomonadota bacterium]